MIAIFQPCQNGGTLFYTPDFQPRCRCTDDYIGSTCNVLNQCRSGPCQNNGTCLTYDEAGNFICICANNYQGTFCEESTCADQDPVLCPLFKSFCDRSTIKNIPVSTYCPLTCAKCKNQFLLFENNFFIC